jgi:hypothetical protein
MPENPGQTAGKTASDRDHRRPNWSWTLSQDWIIRSSFTIATLAFGGALGGGLTVIGGTWSNPQIRTQTIAAIALAVFGIGVAGAGLLIRHGREQMLRSNGIAYIIAAESARWKEDDSRAFLKSVRRQFALTISVLGTGNVRTWAWPLGQGAEQWDSKADELARSFYLLYQTLRDDHLYGPDSGSGVFMWAWWAVAVAFGQRISAIDRGLKIDVWQRPSRGRAGEMEPVPRAQRPHRFAASHQHLALADLQPGSATAERTWTARITITSRNKQPATAEPEPAPTGQSAHPPPSLLLVRLGRQSWGPIPATDDPRTEEPEGDHPLEVELDNAADSVPDGTFTTEIYEINCTRPEGSSEFDWTSFPALVALVTDWICRQAKALPGRTLLLATVIPPEVALGTGIVTGQDAQAGWPAHLWPVLFRYETKTLVIPDLDLGADGILKTGQDEA